MHTYHFIGQAYPSSILISTSPVVSWGVDGERQTKTTIRVRVHGSHVLAEVKCTRMLTDAECVAQRYMVQRIALSSCITWLSPYGSWAAVNIELCLNSDGTTRMEFGTGEKSLKRAFKKHGITGERIDAVFSNDEGYYFRHAMTNINSGPMDDMFMRSHFYQAAEALRNSVAPMRDSRFGKRQAWEKFRSVLGIDDNHIVLQRYDEERHAAYGDYKPMLRNEVNALMEGIADLVSRYIDWFEQTKTSVSKEVAKGA